MTGTGVPAIELTDLHRVFGRTTAAVDGITLRVERGEILTLLGPSGCGKSTTLRCIAGLERPDDGDIQIGGRMVSSKSRRVFLPPERRNVGMVFQSFAVWPHMTVFANVAYPLRIRGWSRDRITARVDEVLQLVQLHGQAQKFPHQMSGGQQQRLALARGLAYNPDVLLLDEPLSNLDAKLRAELREELRDIQRRTALTFVFVTHDQLEACALSDRIAVMRSGRIVQLGQPEELFLRPANRFVAEFMGGANVFEGELGSAGDHVKLASGYLLRIRDRVEHTPPGQRVEVTIRPADIVVTDDAGNAENVVRVQVRRVLFEGDHHSYVLDAPQVGGVLRAYSRARYAPGARLFALLPPEALVTLGDSQAAHEGRVVTEI
jgi:iron(III) transport system ATP-binding protein